MAGRPHYQTRENRFHDPYFGLKQSEYRPISVTTEIVDTDWDEEEITSDLEDDNANSPRVSINSVSEMGATHCL